MLTPGDPNPTMATLSGSSSRGEKPFLSHRANLINYPQVAEGPVASLPEQTGTVLVTQNAAVDLQCALLQAVRKEEQKQPALAWCRLQYTFTVMAQSFVAKPDFYHDTERGRGSGHPAECSHLVLYIVFSEPPGTISTAILASLMLQMVGDKSYKV